MLQGSKSSRTGAVHCVQTCPDCVRAQWTHTHDTRLLSVVTAHAAAFSVPPFGYSEQVLCERISSSLQASSSTVGCQLDWPASPSAAGVWQHVVVGLISLLLARDHTCGPGRWTLVIARWLPCSWQRETSRGSMNMYRVLSSRVTCLHIERCWRTPHPLWEHLPER